MTKSKEIPDFGGMNLYMLRVWFGDKDNAIYNTSVFFKNRYKDDWIVDDFARKVISDIDHSEIDRANLDKGSELYIEGHVDKAVEAFQKAAWAGNDVALYLLGCFLL